MVESSKWKIIDAIGAELGAGDEARRKWRKRGVAHRWRLPILAEAKRRRSPISVEDMEAAQ